MIAIETFMSGMRTGIFAPCRAGESFEPFQPFLIGTREVVLVGEVLAGAESAICCW